MTTTDPALRALRDIAREWDAALPLMGGVDTALRDAIERGRALAAAEAAPLDVERLARAIDETGLVTWDDDPTMLRRKTPTEIATDAAPRYAALRSHDTETAGPDPSSDDVPDLVADAGAIRRPVEDETEWRCSSCFNEHDEFTPHDNEAQAAPPPERVRPGGYLTPPFSAAQAAPPPDYREDGGREGDWVLRHTVDPTAQAAPPPVCAFPGCGLPEHLHGSPAPEPPNPTRSTHRFQAAQPSGLDEEHCCGDLSHMSPEYIAALSPTPDAS